MPGICCPMRNLFPASPPSSHVLSCHAAHRAWTCLLACLPPPDPSRSQSGKGFPHFPDSGYLAIPSILYPRIRRLCLRYHHLCRYSPILSPSTSYCNLSRQGDASATTTPSPPAVLPLNLQVGVHPGLPPGKSTAVLPGLARPWEQDQQLLQRPSASLHFRPCSY